jgi:hypothetical protein
MESVNITAFGTQKHILKQPLLRHSYNSITDQKIMTLRTNYYEANQIKLTIVHCFTF